MSKIISRNWIPVVLAVFVTPLCFAIASNYSGAANVNANPHVTPRVNATQIGEQQAPAREIHAAEINVITANRLETRQLFVLGSVLFAISTAARLLHRRLLDTRGRNTVRRQGPAGVNSLNGLRP